jgi:hypothetical protein
VLASLALAGPWSDPWFYLHFNRILHMRHSVTNASNAFNLLLTEQSKQPQRPFKLLLKNQHLWMNK